VVETPFDGHEVLVEDRVDGVDLGRLLTQRGRPGLPVASVLQWMTQAAEALTALHQNGDVHGDVRPANLLLEPSGSIVLLDPESSPVPHRNGPSASTAGFRAPEVAAGAAPDQAADVYGLAATTFGLLTGAAPAAGTPSGAAHQVSGLEPVLQVGLATDPQQRPATPAELVDRLRAEWDGGTPTGAATILVSDVLDHAPGDEDEPLIAPAELQLAVDRVVEGHGGRRVGLPADGHATVSVFADAIGAVRAAVALQRGLQQTAAALRLRVGLASGQLADASTAEVLSTEAGRVKDLAGQGEIRLASSTAALVRPQLQNEMRLVDVDGAVAIATVGVNAPPDSSRSPYPGLAAFRETDSDLFYGREQVVEQCLGLLRSERFVALVGVSGSGKSSLLQAGLMPRLPHAVLLRPGEHPQQSLVDAGVADRPDAVLVVDQLEDVVTRCQTAEERAAFVDAIVDHPGGLAVALRADRYGEFAQFDELAQLLSTCQAFVGPLDPGLLTRAVTEPARRCGVAVEDGLAELLVSELPGNPGGDLPMLGHALRETWLRRDGNTMTIAGYHETGGVRAAIAQTAERTYGTFDERARAVARRLLLRMVELRTDGVMSRSISAGEAAELDRVRAPAVLSTFATAGLIVTDDQGGATAPEALQSEWPRFAGWIAEQRARLLARKRLFRDHSRVTRLDLVAVGTTLVAVTAVAVGVVAVSERNDAVAEREAAQLRSLVADARASAANQPDAAMLLAVEAHTDTPTVETTGALVDALLSRPSASALLQGSPSAVQAIEIDEASVVAASGNEVRLWTTDGWQQTGGYDIGDAAISDLALGAGGQSLVAAVADDNALISVDAKTGQPVAGPVEFGAMSPVSVVSAGDRVLVVLDDRVNPEIDSLIEQRDLQTLDSAGPTLVPPTSRLEDVAVADDAARAAMTTIDGDVWLADLETGAVVLGAAAPASETDVGIDDLAWHDDLLVAGRADGSVDAWRVDPGGGLTVIARFRAGGPVDAVAVGCDGSCVAAGTADGRVVAWRVGAEQVPLDVPRAHSGRVNDLEFTADGTFLVSAGSDRLTQVHALDGSLTIAPTAVPGGAPARGAYGTGGTIFIGTDDTERGRITRVSASGEMAWQTPLAGAVTWLAAPPGNRVVALARPAGQPVRFLVLDADTGAILMDQALDVPRVTGAVSPDGSTAVLAARETASSYLVTVDLNTLSVSDPTPVSERVTAISFSPNGARIATGHSTGDVALRDLESFTPQVVSPQQLDDSVTTIGFTPDGETVLVGGLAGAVDVLQATTLEPRFAPLEGHRRSVSGVAANDRLVLTAAGDGTVRMWDMASGTAIGGPVPTDGLIAPSIAVHEDGKHALVQGDRGLLELVLDDDEWVRLACSIAGRQLTEDERADYGLAGSASACGSLG
jgi:WD40 repeat protein